MLEMIIAEIAVSILLVIGVLLINVWHEPERRLYQSMGLIPFTAWAATELWHDICLDAGFDDEKR